MDIYLLSTITNIVWYIFTILFVLYRFTTFFSWIWNFLIFLGNLMSVFKWLGNKINYIYNYYKGYRQPFENSFIDDNPYEPLLDKNEKSMIMKVKDNIMNYIPNSWFKNKEDNELYELHISELNTLPKFTKKSKTHTQMSFEHAYYNSNVTLNQSTVQWASPVPLTNTDKKQNDMNDDFGQFESNMLLESKFINDFNKNKLNKIDNNSPAVLEINDQ